MSYQMSLSIAAAFFLSAATALAQGAPPSPPGGPAAGPQGAGFAGKKISKEDLAKFHAQQCLDGYAHEVGAFATLEVRLQLTDQQKSSFERWKHVKLKSAKARADACVGMKLPEPPDAADKMPPVPDPAEGLRMEEKHLKDRLADLKTEIPALEALTASLSDQQKRLLAPPRHDGPQQGGPQGGPGPYNGHGPTGGPGAPPPGGPKE
jgi:hypothetical protein